MEGGGCPGADPGFLKRGTWQHFGELTLRLLRLIINAYCFCFSGKKGGSALPRCPPGCAPGGGTHLKYGPGEVDQK